jgi:hypothetical protein
MLPASSQARCLSLGLGCPRRRRLLGVACRASACCQRIGRFWVGFGAYCLSELFGEALVVGAGGVEVAHTARSSTRAGR